MPRTCDAAENNLAFAERAVLVLADVRDGGDFSIVFENRHALAGQADDAGAVFGNVGDGAGVHVALSRSSRGNVALINFGLGRMSLHTSNIPIRSNFPSRRY